MVTGFDLISHNKPLQKHWVKRVIAYIFDVIISSLAVWIVFLPFTIGFGGQAFLYFPFSAGIVQVFYSAILEYWNRQTIGKMILDLEVEGTFGGLALHEAFIRNISKIHGLLLLLDWIVGMATEGDPRQRYLDRLSETTVVGTAQPKHVADFLSEHIRVPHHHTEEQELTTQHESRTCRECGGELEDIGGGKARCKECGRIQ
ncbi:MAG: RDD family protein [Thermoplasmatota archaeon]